MNTETRCQKAYRRFRAVQQHADAVLRLPMADMDPQEMDNLVAAVNDAYEEYRLALSLVGCEKRLCFTMMVQEIGGGTCPALPKAA